MSARLTVVIVMPRGFDELAEALRHLQAQSRPEAIEVVLVHTPARVHEIDPAAFRMFGHFIAVPVASVPTVASGFVAALAAATGDVVAQMEDHVLLDPGWAEATLVAHEGPWAAVAPRLRNANPATATSWASFVASFASAIVASPREPIDAGPGHNTSYKRQVLLQYRDQLPRLYQSERVFHYRLHSDGHRILHDPRVRQAHINISLPRTALSHAFLGGVLFGAYRSATMSGAEKAARSLGAPLVPPLRFWRTWRMLHSSADVAMPVTAWALLTLLLMAHAAGEVAGYWRLVGDIEAQYEQFELHRLAGLRSDERGLMTGAAGAAPEQVPRHMEPRYVKDQP